MKLRQSFDQFIGSITMYQQLIYALSTIALFSLVLMITGYLTYTPAAFIISIALCIGTAYGANRLFGWLFGIRPHAPSAIITGLILALLFTPPVTIFGTVKIILVVIFAMVSKYLLNVRGKHIFNPAAVAIVIASVTGVAYATWWIATPALLPITALVVLLVLYKNQKFTLFGAYLAAAVGVIVLQGIVGGNLSAQSISAAFVSWPLFFAGGIMLTEPLTLPPRHRQQVIIAILVGILTMLPFKYASILMTPALAIVIGNSIAFGMGMRRAIRLRFTSKKRIGKDGYEFSFDVPLFDFTPGQYVELSLPHQHSDLRGSRRIFTIIGRPEDQQLSIATRIPEKHSSFKSALLGLKTGQTVYGLRVSGDFVAPNDTSVPIMCIAGGIGITPFISFIMNNKGRSITILYLVSSVADIAFVDELRRYEVAVVIVTPDASPLPDKEWQRELGRLTSDSIKNYNSPNSEAYISGPPKMVDTAKRMAREAGISVIHTDHFTGY